MSIKYLTDKENKAIELLVGRLRAYLKDNLVKIQLFGSKARGDFNKDSDIDILVILKEKSLDIIDKIYEIDQDVDLEYDVRTSFKIYDLDEFNKIKNYRTFFYQNIEKEAITI